MFTQKKLYLSTLCLLVKALDDVFNHNHYAEKVLAFHFARNRKMGSHDRQFFAEVFYEIIRWWRKLQFVAEVESEVNGIGSNYDTDLIPQKMIPERAIKLIISAWLLRQGYDLTPFIKEGFGGNREQIEKKWLSAGSAAIEGSYPDWLWKKGQQELGDLWGYLSEVSNFKAPLFLRVNRLLTDPHTLKQKLDKENNFECQMVSDAPDALKLTLRKNVFTTQAFKDGLFEVQDVGSQRIAPLMEVKPGMKVVDACAGAGGKTLHLAALMKNKGKILALDVHPGKLKELRERTRRARVSNVDVKLIDSTKVIKRLNGQVDRLLLDVPCTGLGVLRRKPDTKWKLTWEECDRLNKIQHALLKDYCSMVKRGGKMIYATCSILPSENEKQIQIFLETHPEWQLETEVHFKPEVGGGDGFYGARLIRHSNANELIG